MKKAFFSTIIILISTFSLMAQVNKTGKAVISTPGVHCELCQNRIENYLSRQDGVISVSVNLRKKTTTVSWIPDRTNIEEIKANINNAGYDADKEAAEESAYHRLPKQCQIKPMKDSSHTETIKQ